MTAADYVKYFLFIGRNWNYRLAFFTIYHEIRGERKYGLDTGKIDFLKNERIESRNLSHASIYQASGYYLLEKAFGYLQEEQQIDGGLVDFGCGKGRVLLVAAHYGFKKITGIDFSKVLCAEAEKNISKIRSHFPEASARISCGDAADYAVQEDDTVFFFFNPFNEKVMLPVVRNILGSFKKAPREIKVLYLNPVHKEIFLSAGFTEEYHLLRLTYIELSVLVMRPSIV